MGKCIAPFLGALLLLGTRSSSVCAAETARGAWIQVGFVAERVGFVTPTHSRYPAEFWSGWSVALGHRPQTGLEFGGCFSVASKYDTWTNPTATLLEATCAREFGRNEHFGGRLRGSLGYARVGAFTSAIGEWAGELTGYGPTASLGLELRLQPLELLALCGFAQLRVSRIRLQGNDSPAVADTEFSLGGPSFGVAVRAHLLPPDVK